MEERYIYFVSYVGIKQNGQVFFGNRELNTDGRITSISELRVIEKQMKDKLNFENEFAILGYQLLRTEQEKIRV